MLVPCYALGDALWKTHELDTMDGSELQSANPCAWQGGESLVREGLVLVPENQGVGKVNGKQLAARAHIHGAPGPASVAGAVALIEARHNKARHTTLQRAHILPSTTQDAEAHRRTPKHF